MFINFNFSPGWGSWNGVWLGGAGGEGVPWTLAPSITPGLQGAASTPSSCEVSRARRADQSEADAVIGEEEAVTYISQDEGCLIILWFGNVHVLSVFRSDYRLVFVLSVMITEHPCLMLMFYESLMFNRRNQDVADRTRPAPYNTKAQLIVSARLPVPRCQGLPCPCSVLCFFISATRLIIMGTCPEEEWEKFNFFVSTYSS